MLDSQILWLICGAGFVLLAIGCLALCVAFWVQNKELKQLRRDVTKCVIRILDLEKAEGK